MFHTTVRLFRVLSKKYFILPRPSVRIPLLGGAIKNSTYNIIASKHGAFQVIT
jgi:hypothetical protein